MGECRRIRFRDVLSARFWVNYAAILALTSWVPMLTRKSILQNEAGEVLRESVTSLRVYECYLGFLRRPDRWYFTAIFLHLFLCFFVSFWVWYIVLRFREGGRGTKPHGSGEDCGAQSERLR